MLRLLALLLMPLLAVAAPVPKAKLTMEVVFGERTTPNSRHAVEFDDRGRLTVTVPTTVPRVRARGGELHLPLLAKEVEGDFRLTACVSSKLPAAGTSDPKEFNGAAVVFGVSVYGTADKKVRGAEFGVLWQDDGEWSGVLTSTSVKAGQVSRVEAGDEKKPAAPPSHLRVTRRGPRLTCETSEDGEKWEEFFTEEHPDLPAKVKVGPVVFGTTEQEFSAAFDEYEIKPLAKDEKK